MAVNVYRRYGDDWQAIGCFSDAGIEGRTFTYDASYITSIGSNPVSLSLPLRERPYSRSEYQGFFGGLLPEEGMLRKVARRYQLESSDFIGVLEHLGFECAGALLFAADDVDVKGIVPRYRHLGKGELEGLVEGDAEVVVDLLGEARLSLAGAQGKLGLIQKNYSGWEEE